MSQENLAAFLHQASQDDTLRQQAMDQQTADGLVRLGAVHGFDFTAADVAGLPQPEGELSEDQLEAVAGGGGFRPPDINKTIQWVLKEAYMENNKDLQFYKSKYNQAKKYLK